MKKIILYGILTGLAVSGWMYIEFRQGFHSSEYGRYSSFLSIFIIILGLVAGIRSYRKNEKGGQLNYWQGVFAGVLLSVVAGLVTGIFAYCYHAVLNPGFADFVVEMNRKVLMQHQATATQLQENADMTRNLYQPWPQAWRTFGGFVFSGALISLIISGLLKTRRMTD